MLLCSNAFFVIFRILFHRSGPPAIPHHTRSLAQHEPSSRPALNRNKPRCFGYLEIVHARDCLDDLAEGVQMVNGVPEMGAGLHWTFDTSNSASMNSASSSARLTVITSDFVRMSLRPVASAGATPASDPSRSCNRRHREWCAACRRLWSGEVGLGSGRDTQDATTWTDV
jgi:hypothetical protein